MDKYLPSYTSISWVSSFLIYSFNSSSFHIMSGFLSLSPCALLLLSGNASLVPCNFLFFRNMSFFMFLNVFHLLLLCSLSSACLCSSSSFSLASSASSHQDSSSPGVFSSATFEPMAVTLADPAGARVVAGAVGRAAGMVFDLMGDHSSTLASFAFT